MEFVDLDDFKWKYEYLRQIYNTSSIYHNNLLIYGSDRNLALHFVLEFIKSLYCSEKKEYPCNNCNYCKSIDDFSNFNLKIIMPLANELSEINRDINTTFCNYIKENKIINEASWGKILKSTGNLVINKNSIVSIKEFMSIESVNDNPKICIIWLPELLNNSSANSLLKILEEPVKNSFFIFITNDSEKVLSTIKSRTIKVFFEDKTIVENNNDENKNLYEDIFIDFLRISFVNNYEKNIEFIDKITKTNGKKEFSQILCNGLMILKNIIYIKQNINNNISFNNQETIDKISNIVDFFSLKSIIKELEKSLFLLQNNANVKIVIFNSIIKLNKIIKKK